MLSPPSLVCLSDGYFNPEVVKYRQLCAKSQRRRHLYSLQQYYHKLLNQILVSRKVTAAPRTCSTTVCLCAFVPVSLSVCLSVSLSVSVCTLWHLSLLPLSSPLLPLCCRSCWIWLRGAVLSWP